jgi:hypothetical protein
MNETTKILMNKRGLNVNSRETKMRKMEEEHNFMEEWRRRNNTFILGIEEFRHESYFYTLKITEDILRMKLKVDISSWRIDSVRRVGTRTGGRPTLVRRISFTKKVEVLHAT